MSKGSKQDVNQTYKVLREYETDISVINPLETNPLVKERLNSKVAFVPVESVPMISTVDNNPPVDPYPYSLFDRLLY